MPEKWQGTNILTGGYFAYMMVEKAISSCTTLESYKISVAYKNEPKVCFNALNLGIWQKSAHNTLIRIPMDNLMDKYQCQGSQRFQKTSHEPHQETSDHNCYRCWRRRHPYWKSRNRRGDKRNQTSNWGTKIQRSRRRGRILRGMMHSLQMKPPRMKNLSNRPTRE